MKIKEVSVNDYLEKEFNYPVYSNIDVLDYNHSDTTENTIDNFIKILNSLYQLFLNLTPLLIFSLQVIIIIQRLLI